MNILGKTLFGLVTAGLVVSACSAPPPRETVTVTQTQPTANPSPTSETRGKTVKVPNVVGMVHQQAQDTMQAAGLRNLAEEDATGKGRLLLNDRNWKVVSQEPAAGTVVELDRRILLKSKKDGDR
ncbi:PASTA domain-containing protein [Crossiella sp. SN42]|uniref:PASTA domain-containing protein n=1 Tax=Crossiella sp. SN42 TaxID=2944808 RepID=UPI00207CB830|nr:PASTA domain-containing protein [Crossiella sp. SN42]MCO1579454.1 PASTA domain-containing protein [Crossiella sp. SN42]